jgi:PAS domain S-box-containing protein
MHEANPWSRWRVYAYAVVFAALVVMLRELAMPWMGHQPFLPIFLIPVIFTAYMGGLRPGLFATALAGLSCKLWVLAPFGTLWFDTARDFALWLSLLLAGVIVSVLFEELQQWRRKDTEQLTEPRHATTEKKVRVGFAISLAFLGVIGIASYLSVARFSQNTALMAHSQAVVSTIDALVETVLNMETAERAYVVSGDESRAPDYARETERVDALLRKLHDAVNTNRVQLARTQQLDDAVQARMKLSAELVAIGRASGAQAVQQYLARTPTPLGPEGKSRMHRLAREMKETELQILNASEREALAGARSTQLIIVGGGGLALIFVALALYAIRRDLRARAHAEAELNRFFELTIDLFTIATPDGRFKRVSPAFEEILGYTTEEALALDYMKMQHPDDLARTHEVVERQSKRGEKVEHFESRFRHKDGRYRVLSWRSQPHGGLFYATARDVTEATAASDALREAKERLEERVAERTRELAGLNIALQRAYDDLRASQQQVTQQERLRALGQMASGIAHDINNAISPVALYTEALLAHETSLSPRARSQLEIIQRAVDDIAQTVARMGEFYRQRDFQQPHTLVDLNNLVGQVIALTRARWSDMAQQRGTAIEMRTELAADLPPVSASESQIREALVNLVFNAVDAMPEGGPITLRTRLDTRGDASNVLLEVEDKGVGMDEDTRRRCLEPFFTTKGERGTGLGLAMVYGIAQRHGAGLEIESEPGKGTVIRMSFPVMAPRIA